MTRSETDKTNADALLIERAIEHEAQRMSQDLTLLDWRRLDPEVLAFTYHYDTVIDGRRCRTTRWAVYCGASPNGAGGIVNTEWDE